jgi:hypothetical protein
MVLAAVGAFFTRAYRTISARYLDEQRETLAAADAA